MKSFSPTTCEALDHYVYELIDPRDDSIFYVGAGSNNRIFSHEIEANESIEVTKAKIEKIRDIKDAGYSVKKIIVHSGMDAATAFECESTLIDALSAIGVNLTNVISGHHSSIMTVEDAEVLYGSEKIYADDYPEYKFLVLTIINPISSYKDEGWRNDWILTDSSLSSADYLCFQFGNVIRKVFKLHHDSSDWFIYGSQTKTNKDGSPKVMRNFIGMDEVPDHFLNNKIIYENEEHEIKSKKRGGAQWNRKYYNINKI